MPIIPGLNDEEENIRAAAQMLKDLNIEKIKLLPYKELARMKYGALKNRCDAPAKR